MIEHNTFWCGLLTRLEHGKLDIFSVHMGIYVCDNWLWIFKTFRSNININLTLHW